MKQQIPAHPRAIAMLMAAVALPLTPVFAQQAANAPPVAVTVAPPVAPQPVAEPSTPPAAAPAPVYAPSAPVVQAVPIRPAPPVEPVAQAVPSPTPRATASRSAPRRDARAVAAPVAVAPVAVAPVPEVAPSVAPVQAPVAVETLPSTIPQSVTEPVAAVEPETVDTTPWAMIIAGIAALAAIILALMFMRRRGRKTVAAERPAYVAPTAVREPVDPVMRSTVAPLAAKPMMREPIQPIAPKSVTPVVSATGERPWIGLSLAPICAGTTEDGTMVQYELIVDNASDVEAHDVRVSSFLIDGARSSGAEQAMIEPLGETQSQTVDIAANGSVPITTTIHVDRNDLSADAFEPKIVAEARYPLPGGGEGHFAARFAIGITDGDAIKAVGLRDGDGMHDDVGAELDDVLERA